MLGTSLLIFGVLLLLIRTKIGQILLILYVLFLATSLLFIAFEKDPHIKFIEDNNLIVDKKESLSAESGPSRYHASDENNYYYIVPGFYRVMPKENECRGFNRFEFDTWCIESPADFKCYPEESGEQGCGVLQFNP